MCEEDLGDIVPFMVVGGTGDGAFLCLIYFRLLENKNL